MGTHLTKKKQGEQALAISPFITIFIDEAYKISEITELITPGRFLFNAGATPKAWNRKMLSNSHVKVTYYNSNSSVVFENTDIKGGVAVTLYDEKQDFGEIGTFTIFNELNSIVKKVNPFIRGSSPKCWCKLNSANLSFHKLKHTGFF